MKSIDVDRIYCEDCRETMARMPANLINCIVTSPPFWGLRDYGVDGQIGLEQSPDEYVAQLVDVFRGARRVLRDDGVLWLNLGDKHVTAPNSNTLASSTLTGSMKGQEEYRRARKNRTIKSGLASKNLVGIPWRVAFALQADGWYLRQDIIWSKPNPMPESVRDRCTKAHEYIFLLTKSARYSYDADAIAEKADPNNWRECYTARRCTPPGTSPDSGFSKPREYETRNKRSVWEITTKPFTEAHFATFPPEIPITCIKAGCPEGGIVYDPFMGAGTTALVARQLNRRFIGSELNPEYVAIAEKRIKPYMDQVTIFDQMREAQ